MKNKIIVILACVVLMCSSMLFASATDVEPSNYESQMAYFSEVVPEENEDDTFVVYIPTEEAITTMSPEEVYESKYQEALVRQSVLISERDAVNESIVKAEKGYDLSINVKFLCSVKGDISITLRNKDTQMLYQITLRAVDGYYHYHEYPAGNYELVDGHTSNPDCIVESRAFSLGKAEHIGVTIYVFDDENEYSKEKQKDIELASELAANTIKADTTAEDTIAPTTADSESNSHIKLPFGVFVICIGVLVAVAGVIIYKARKKSENEE